jgi:hypothetical protein
VIARASDEIRLFLPIIILTVFTHEWRNAR